MNLPFNRKRDGDTAVLDPDVQPPPPAPEDTYTPGSPDDPAMWPAGDDVERSSRRAIPREHFDLLEGRYTTTKASTTAQIITVLVMLLIVGSVGGYGGYNMLQRDAAEEDLTRTTREVRDATTRLAQLAGTPLDENEIRSHLDQRAQLIQSATGGRIDVPIVLDEIRQIAGPMDILSITIAARPGAGEDDIEEIGSVQITGRAPTLEEIIAWNTRLEALDLTVSVPDTTYNGVGAEDAELAERGLAFDTSVALGPLAGSDQAQLIDQQLFPENYTGDVAVEDDSSAAATPSNTDGGNSDTAAVENDDTPGSLTDVVEE